MTGQNGKNPDLDKILLVDSSFEITSLKGKENQYLKIISFDYDAHRILLDGGISHEVSDIYLTKSELDEIQKKSYELSEWSKQKEILSSLEYDEINLGNLVYIDFMDFVVGFLKKFYEISKIAQQNHECEFVTSSGLSGVAQLLANSSKLADKTVIAQSESIKHSYRMGQKSISITISKKNYLTLKNITESFFQKIFRFDKPKNQNKHVLLVEFDPTKYKKLLFSSKTHSQNLLLYNRRWPTIWNLDSFNIIRKSDCRIASLKTLANNELLAKIEKSQERVVYTLTNLWESDFIGSFFSHNGKSFWVALKPFFEDLIGRKMIDAVKEIEVAKILLEKYQIGSIMILSEIGFNEQIMMHLARKNNIPVVMMQHGVPYETKEAYVRNNLLGFFPNFSDYMVVWGSATKVYLEKSGVSTSKIRALGSSIYDDLFEKKHSLKKETILLATSPPMKDLIYDNLVQTNENYRLAIEKVCKIAVKLNQKLVIKLHPSLVDFDVESVVAKISSEIVVIKHGSIFPFIEDCKLLLTFDLSTTLLEAQILKKPAVSIYLKEYGFGESDIFKEGSCISTPIENLEEILAKIIHDEPYCQELVRNGDRFVERYLDNRGTSSKSLIDFLKSF
jgi:hypothetical protein